MNVLKQSWFTSSLVLIGCLISANSSAAENVKLVPQTGITATFVDSLSISHDGKYAVTGDWDGSLRLWDVATGFELRKLIGDGQQKVHEGFSSIDRISGRFAPDRHQILYFGDESSGLIDLIDPGKSFEIARRYDFASFAENGDTIVYCSGLTDHGRGWSSVGLHVYNSTNGKLVSKQTVQLSESISATSCVTIPNEPVVLIGFFKANSEGMALIGWDYSKQKIVESYSSPNGIRRIEVDTSGNRIFAVGHYHNAYVWERNNPVPLRAYGNRKSNDYSEGEIICDK